jgi:hypothetical protein
MKRLLGLTAMIAATLGVVMIGAGILFITKGFDARADIEAALLQEQVVTSQDASIPGALVQDAATARAQQDTIESHTYGKWGPYAAMDREDPKRASYITGLTLRNSLNMAVMGFGVADLAIGTGVVAMALGLAITGLAVPGMYLMRQPEELPGRRPVRQASTAPA